MSKLWILVALMVCLVGLMGRPAMAQTPPPAGDSTPEGVGPNPNPVGGAPLTSSGAEASPNYLLRPGDELVITFLGVQDPPYDVRLREDGGIYIPRIGDVHAAGHTINELRPIMEQRLSKHLLHSQVEIGLRATAPQFAMVFGEVTKPGQIQVAEGTTLVQALSEAGGFAIQADQSEVTLVRNKQTLHVLLQASGEPPTVNPGDVIYVQKAGRVSVMGSVNTPAIVTINGASSSVWEAIMQAGGPKPEAAMSRIRLVRFGATTQNDAQGRVLDLSLGPASKDGQLPVANGDAITVPEQRVLFVAVGQGGKTASLPIQGPTNLLDVLVAAGVGDKQTLKKVAIIRARDVNKLGAGGGVNPLAAKALADKNRAAASKTAPKVDATPVANATPTAVSTPAPPATPVSDATPTAVTTPATVSTPAAVTTPTAVASQTPATTDTPKPVASRSDNDPMSLDSSPKGDSKTETTAVPDKEMTPDNVEVVDVADALKHGTTAKLTTVSDGDVVVVNPPNAQTGMASWLQWTSIFNMIYYLRYL